MRWDWRIQPRGFTRDHGGQVGTKLQNLSVQRILGCFITGWISERMCRALRCGSCQAVLAQPGPQADLQHLLQGLNEAGGQKALGGGRDLPSHVQTLCPVVPKHILLRQTLYPIWGA